MTVPEELVVAAIVVAAGAGTRLGADVPKAFCEVGGRTLLDHAVARFSAHPAVRDIIVVVPANMLDRVVEAVAVAGGASRPESVAAGIAALADDVDAVLVHDAARPFVPAEVITRVVGALRAGADAVVPTVPVVDTIKRVFEGVVVETVDRAALQAVQTPQGFRRSVLVRAHAHASAVTDDAMLVERAGGTVVVVAGADECFKITRPWDLRVAEALMGSL